MNELKKKKTDYFQGSLGTGFARSNCIKPDLGSIAGSAVGLDVYHKPLNSQDPLSAIQ
jgi:hypothetical protein